MPCREALALRFAASDFLSGHSLVYIASSLALRSRYITVNEAALMATADESSSPRAVVIGVPLPTQAEIKIR